MGAAKKGNLEAVMKNIGDVKKVDGHGETALMKATYNGHANCISLPEKEVGMQNK